MSYDAAIQQQEAYSLTLLGCQATLVTEESCLFLTSLLTHLLRRMHYRLVTQKTNWTKTVDYYTVIIK